MRIRKWWEWVGSPGVRYFPRMEMDINRKFPGLWSGLVMIHSWLLEDRPSSCWEEQLQKHLVLHVVGRKLLCTVEHLLSCPQKEDNPHNPETWQCWCLLSQGREGQPVLGTGNPAVLPQHRRPEVRLQREHQERRFSDTSQRLTGTSWMLVYRFFCSQSSS